MEIIDIDLELNENLANDLKQHYDPKRNIQHIHDSQSGASPSHLHNDSGFLTQNIDGSQNAAIETEKNNREKNATSSKSKSNSTDGNDLDTATVHSPSESLQNSIATETKNINDNQKLATSSMHGKNQKPKGCEKVKKIEENLDDKKRHNTRSAHNS